MAGPNTVDFDALLSLITTTVEPDSWAEFGGPGSLSPFEANLSLVIRQTEQVHEEIRDLLDQLRRLQNLQVTIEVRFVTVTDKFFEQIGVDFDFDIQDNVGHVFNNTLHRGEFVLSPPDLDLRYRTALQTG